MNNPHLTNTSSFGPALWQPKVEIFGLVIDLQGASFVIALILLPFLCGLIIRRQPVIGSALFVLIGSHILVHIFWVYFWSVSKYGEPVPLNWTILPQNLLWALPSFLVGLMAASLFRERASKIVQTDSRCDDTIDQLIVVKGLDG